jgi:hypothetical protein
MNIRSKLECLSQVNLSLLERLAKEKRCSLFGLTISDELKHFKTLATGAEVINLFMSVK